MRVVVISGYFNPLHTGHLDYIKAASKLGDKLIAIVNNDHQVELKGTVPFMNAYDRMRMVDAIKGVSKTVLSIDTDGSVVETLKSIYSECAVDWDFDSMIFANGGDVGLGTSKEHSYCKKRNIKTAYGVGGAKTQSSSELLKSKEKESTNDNT